MDRLSAGIGSAFPASCLPESSGLSQFDPELLYVECRLCGRPVYWGEGLSTLIVAGAGIPQGSLDARCMILTNGCDHCKPHGRHEHIIIRISSSGKYDRLLDEPAGSA